MEDKEIITKNRQNKANGKLKVKRGGRAGGTPFKKGHNKPGPGRPKMTELQKVAARYTREREKLKWCYYRNMIEADLLSLAKKHKDSGKTLLTIDEISKIRALLGAIKREDIKTLMAIEEFCNGPLPKKDMTENERTAIGLEKYEKTTTTITTTTEKRIGQILIIPGNGREAIIDEATGLPIEQ